MRIEMIMIPEDKLKKNCARISIKKSINDFDNGEK